MILGAREKINPNSRLGNCREEDNRFQAGRVNRECDALHFWSRHPNGAHFLYADCSVHFLTYSADSILPALATRAGNETVGLAE